MIDFVYDDGGRHEAGYRGKAQDCVVRAIAIATEQPYSEVYDTLFASMRYDRMLERATVPGTPKYKESPRNGVANTISRPYLTAKGWIWTPTMRIGSGCKVHLRADELPGGRIICKLSRHLVAVINGVIHDTYDCSRDGTRCVYGYWSLA
jgi:hypothetical protein